MRLRLAWLRLLAQIDRWMILQGAKTLEEIEIWSEAARVRHVQITAVMIRRRDSLRRLNQEIAMLEAPEKLIREAR